MSKRPADSKPKTKSLPLAKKPRTSEPEPDASLVPTHERADWNPANAVMQQVLGMPELRGEVLVRLFDNHGGSEAAWSLLLVSKAWHAEVKHMVFAQVLDVRHAAILGALDTWKAQVAGTDTYDAPFVWPQGRHLVPNPRLSHGWSKKDGAAETRAILAPKDLVYRPWVLLWAQSRFPPPSPTSPSPPYAEFLKIKLARYATHEWFAPILLGVRDEEKDELGRLGLASLAKMDLVPQLMRIFTYSTIGFHLADLVIASLGLDGRALAAFLLFLSSCHVQSVVCNFLSGTNVIWLALPPAMRFFADGKITKKLIGPMSPAKYEYAIWKGLCAGLSATEGKDWCSK